MMNRFKWGGLDKPGLYIDETVMRMCYTHRHLLAQLAMQLIAEGQNAKAEKVLRKAEKVLPEYNVPYTFLSGAADMARAYALIGKKADAARILNKVWADAKSYADYYLQLTGSRFMMSQNDVLRQLYIMQNIADITQACDHSLADQRLKTVNALYAVYQAKGGAPYDGE